MKNRRYIRLALLAALLTLFALGARAEVRFNEVMASTAIYVDGQSYDWVELYNDGAAVSLKGWYLSNDAYRLTRWAFPDDAKIAGDGCLVIYCAGETVTDGQKGALYTDFKLSAKGDSLFLTDPSGVTTRLDFGAQYGNVSSGIPREGGAWQYFETATPGKANAKTGYASRADEPVIVTEAGFYSDSVRVEMQGAPGQQIRYTTDGSEPTRDSRLYDSAFTLSATTVVRARAFAGDLLASTTAGSTFFINDPAIVSVVSLYTDNAYLFNSKTGLMVKGSGNTPNYEKDWQYPVQIEYFDVNGARQLSQMGTFKISGHSSRAGKQKSLAVYARSAYGSDTFACSFFDDRAYTEYSSILLRCTNSDYRSCRLRDAVLMQISEGLGLYYQAARPILVYINGDYYGHYNLREKANKASLAQWEGITDEETIAGVDIIEGTGQNKSQVLSGSNADWIALCDFCKKNSLNTPENLQYVLDRLDVDSLFNYAIFNMIIGNYDAGNVRYYRFPGGKWTFMLHDIEAGCMNDRESPVDLMLRKKSGSSSAFPHWPLAALLEVAEYKEMFLRRVAEIVESNFLYSTQVEPIYQQWLDILSELMPRHIKKFRHFTFNEWNTNVHASMYYARIRPKKVIGLICTRLNVSSAQKKEYFGETLELLAVYNAKK